MKNKTLRSFVVLSFCLPFLFVGCISRTVYKSNPDDTAKAYSKGFTDADKECIQIQKKAKRFINALQKEIAVKNVVLDKFNQVDKKGNLRSLPKNTSWDNPTGKENWQK